MHNYVHNWNIYTRCSDCSDLNDKLHIDLFV